MPVDDLHAPIGAPGAPAPARTAAPLPRGAVVGALCALAIAGGYGWLKASDRAGLGGEPGAVARIETPPAAVAAAPTSTPDQPRADASPTGTIAGADPTAPPRATADEIERVNGVRVVRQGGGDAPGSMIITVPQEGVSVSLTPAPDMRLVERGAHGPLPRIGADGAKPMQVYARPVMLPASLPPGAPRIAIMVGGMGLSQTATKLALDKLPPGVTLAFAPYGQGLEAQVARARARGHEAVLQAPMEPFDLVGDGPGPHMLRAGQDRAQTRGDLHWLMSRFTGYVGVANFLGAKFTADPRALAPVLEEIAARGLIYIDDGSSNRSVAGRLALGASAPFLAADVILDSERDALAIDAALRKLEDQARAKGSAFGVANGLPDVVTRIGAFARGLDKRGVALVPVSALAGAAPANARNAP